MFKKNPVKVAKSHLLKSSDRKGLQTELQKQFPSLPNNDPLWERIIPARNKQIEIQCVKIQKPYNITLYTVDNVPMFFTDNEFSETDYYPTIFCLMIAPNLMPTLLIYTQVSCYMLSGADLMTPGISGRLNKDIKFANNDKIAIRVYGNNVPFCVGVSLGDSNTLRVSTEGKGVRVMHLFNDNLWIYGFTHQKEKERVIPEGFTAKQILPVAQVEDVDSDDEEEKSQEATKEGESVQESNGEQSVEPSTEIKEGVVTPEEMDKYLETAFMETIKNHIVDDELPLDISAVYTRMIMNSGIHLDVKKSTYKKIGKFIKEMVQKKRIKTKEARDVVQVVSVNRSHQEYKSHVSLPTVVKQTPVEQPKEQSVASKKVQILYFFKVPKLLIPIFAVDGPVDADKSVFTEKETKQHLMKYLVKECKLPEQHNGNATLNQFLFEQLFRTKKEEKDPLQEGSLTSIARIHKKLLEKLKPHYAIKVGNQSDDTLVIHKGECNGISIETDSVMGNKAVTKVNGLKPFLVPIDDNNKKSVSLDCAEFWEFVRLCKTKASASVKTNTEADVHKNESEVLIQGNVVVQISDLLMNEYGIPKNLIIVNDKLKKKKKK